MAKFQLFTAPGTCARVTAIVLEEIGVPYETQLVRFRKGEQKSPEFKRLNPKGRVPLLVIDGEPLTETVAIISHLDALYPEAGLLPAAPDALARARQIADLCFCSSTLFAYLPRINFPQRIAQADAAHSVFTIACAGIAEYFALIDARLASRPWWYGENWSAVDAYIYWIFWRARAGGLDVADYPNFSAHAAAMETRPATRRALAREAADEAALDAEGLPLPKPPYARSTGPAVDPGLGPSGAPVQQSAVIGAS